MKFRNLSGKFILRTEDGEIVAYSMNETFELELNATQIKAFGDKIAPEDPEAVEAFKKAGVTPRHVPNYDWGAHREWQRWRAVGGAHPTGSPLPEDATSGSPSIPGGEAA